MAGADFTPPDAVKAIAGRGALQAGGHLVESEPPGLRRHVRRSGRRHPVQLVPEHDDRARETDDANDGTDDQTNPEVDEKQPPSRRALARAIDERHQNITFSETVAERGDPRSHCVAEPESA